MSLVTRVVVAVVLVAVAFGGALLDNLVTQRDLVDRLSRINDGWVPVTRGLDGVSRDVRTLAGITQSADPDVLRQSLRASLNTFSTTDRVDAGLGHLAERIEALRESPVSPAERAFLANTAGLVADLQGEGRDLATLADELLEALETEAPDVPSHRARLHRALAALDKRIVDLAEVVEAHTDGEVSAVRDAESRIVVRVASTTVIATALALLVVALMARALRPIRRLTAAAARIRDGEYPSEAIDAGNDEVGVLAREFTSMAEAIADRDQRLREQNDAVERAYTELVSAQKARVDAERLAAVGEMSARITHEIRNPLSSIGLNVEMLTDELDETSPDLIAAREMLASIDREVSRLTTLTDDYLRGARESHVERAFALAPLVREVAEQVAPLIERDGGKLVLELDKTVHITGHDELLRQVLWNLLGNAQQALEGHDGEHRVRVRLEASSGTAYLTVDDSGPGLPDGDVDRLFEAFVTTREHGTGLGLNISRHIAEGHGGTLTAAETGPLGGARFLLRLPTTEISPDAAGSAPEATT